MPWDIVKSGDKYNVVKKSTGKPVGRGLSKTRAAAMLRALYANEPTMNGYPLYGQKRCPNCGAKIPRNAKVCPYCGYKVKGTYTNNMKTTTRNLTSNAIISRKSLVGKMKNEKATCATCGGATKGGKCVNCGGVANAAQEVRREWINELVDAGYEAGILSELNNNELAELIQEERVDNVWSDAARAAAKQKRGARHTQIYELLTKKNFKPAGSSAYSASYTRKIQDNKMYPHRVEVDRENGHWSYSQAGKRASGTGHKSLAAHLKSVGIK